MGLTLQEISDRFEIMDLLVDYCSAIDSHDIEALSRIFTKDAKIDFSKAGGPCAGLKVIQEFLTKNLGTLPRQHMITNFKISIAEDAAAVRSLCYNPLELSKSSKEVAVWGLWYNDRCIRTPQGWRIQERVTDPCYSWKFLRTDG